MEFDNPESELFIYCLLFQKIEIANIFWREGKVFDLHKNERKRTNEYNFMYFKESANKCFNCK
jgi:hypothetical protein